MNNRIKFLYKYLLIAITLAVFLFSFNCVDAGALNPSAADEIAEQETEFASTAGFDLNMEIGDILAATVKGFIALLGIIFVILIIIAGNKWMNAGGDQDKVREAKDTIRNAIIGLIIIIAAYAITEFVFTRLPWGTGTGVNTHTGG